MNQHVIEHRRIIQASRTTREAVCRSYGWPDPTAHDTESLAVDVLRYQRQSVGYGAVTQTMRVVMGWWRSAQL